MSIFDIESFTPVELFKVTDKNLTMETFYLDELVDYQQWIRGISTQLFKILGNQFLARITECETNFAEIMLPHLSQIILYFANQTYLTVLQNTVKLFFQRHFEISTNQSTETNISLNSSIFMNKSSIKLMLDIVECIRMYNQLYVIISLLIISCYFDLKKCVFFSSKFGSKQIELDYLHIAQAALFCEAYFTSVLYCELWKIQERNETEPITTNLRSIMKNVKISSFIRLNVFIKFQLLSFHFSRIC